jgi:hypothetical protein
MADPDEKIRQGQRAAQILNDDTFKAVIRALRDKALEQFKTAKPSDADALQAAKVRYEVVEQIVSELDDMKRDGDFEKRKKDDAKPPIKPSDQFVPRHGFPQ